MDPRKTTIGSILHTLARRAIINDTPSLYAQVLLTHVLGKSRSWVLAHPEVTLSAEQERALEEAIQQLEEGIPLPYVLGHWEFFGLDFELTSDVLIPRPETELLVEQAIADCRLRIADCSVFHLPPSSSLLWAVDVGAGCGCIAISLAVHIPNLQVIAADISLPALQLARRNAKKHNVADRVHLIQTDLLSPFLPCPSAPLPLRPSAPLLPSSLAPQLPCSPALPLPSPPAPFQLICANLPYVPTSTLQTLKVYGKEPTLALDGGRDGLSLIRRLLQDAPRRLAPGGLLLLEIEESQGEAARHLAEEAFSEADVKVLPDLAGRDRLLVVKPRESNG